MLSLVCAVLFSAKCGKLFQNSYYTASEAISEVAFQLSRRSQAQCLMKTLPILLVRLLQ